MRKIDKNGIMYILNIDNTLTVKGLSRLSRTKNLHIPNQVDGYIVKDIADEAFLCCEQIERVQIDGELNYIGKQAFNECYNLYEVQICSSEVVKIDARAFEGCVSMDTFNSTGAIQLCGFNVFAYCESLKGFMCQLVGEIPDETFCNCIHLEKIKINSAIVKLGHDVFLSCPALKEIKIYATSLNYDASFLQQIRSVAIYCFPDSNLADLSYFGYNIEFFV